MARCGCNNAASTSCDAIMSCIADNLGRGLEFNEATGQIDLRLSTDADNVAAIGTDDGFFSPTVTGPGEMVWPLTVATLPAQAISAVAGSNLVGPATAPQMIEYSVANGIDIYSVGVYGIADNTVFEQIGAMTTSVTTYTDNPGDMAQRYMSSLTVQNLHYDAGSRDNPTGRNSDAPVSLLTPDGGWGGFYAPVFKPRTIDETLRIVRGRMVVELTVQRLTLTEAQIEAHLIATVDAVVRAGAQDWVIIQVPPLLDDDSRAPIDDWVAIVTDAGITAGLNLNSEWQMPAPFTAAEIVASGATWVTIGTQSVANGATDARITELVTAGLEVAGITSARQYWTTHAFGLGVRAVRSSDAVYARGVRGVAGDLNYRQPLIPGLSTRTTATGALTAVTDVETAMWNPGFARTDQPGRWFPEQYGWPSPTSQLVRNSQLLGTICPIPNATNYVIELRVRRETFVGTANRSAGLFFAVPDDRGISFPDTGSTNTFANGYQAFLHSRTTGTTMQLYRVTNGLQTSLGSITTGTVTYTANTWITLRATVTPAGVTFEAVSGVTNSISSGDTTWRGAYAYYLWDDQSGEMVHGYDNPLDLVMYEAL
jgi:hypothetical protein